MGLGCRVCHQRFYQPSPADKDPFRTYVRKAKLGSNAFGSNAFGAVPCQSCDGYFSRRDRAWAFIFSFIFRDNLSSLSASLSHPDGCNARCRRSCVHPCIVLACAHAIMPCVPACLRACVPACLCACVPACLCAWRAWLRQRLRLRRRPRPVAKAQAVPPGSRGQGSGCATWQSRTSFLSAA